MKMQGNPLDVNILTEVYINEEINHREIVDTPQETESLANSIEDSGGLLQRIIIYPTPADRLKSHGMPYELGSGYRRCAALIYLAEKLSDTGWVESVPAELREGLTAGRRALDQLMENLQRKDLKPMEQAIAMREVMLEKDHGLTQTDLARAVGMPVSTVSNFLTTANFLTPNVADLALKGTLGWAHAKDLAGFTKKFKIDAPMQATLAAVGTGLSHADFLKHLNEKYEVAAPADDEAVGAGTVAEDGVSTGKSEGGQEGAEAGATDNQRTYTTMRSKEISDKYIPKFKALQTDAKSEAEKAAWAIRIDTLNFAMKMEGTTLGSILAPWEEEELEKAEELKAAEEEVRLRKSYIRRTVTFMKQELKKAPPISLADGSPNPNRSMPTLAQVLQSVKQNITDSLAKGKEAGLGENVCIDGFPVPSVDEFMKTINSEFAASQKKENESNQKRKDAAEARKLEADAKKAAAEEAGASGEAKAEELATA